MGSYYEILGVEPDATQDEIKRAYRKLAKKYHPDSKDSDPESNAKFQEISEAYATLSDPEQRRKYDYLGHETYRQANSTAKSRPFDEETEDGHCGACDLGRKKKEEEGPPPKSIRIAVHLTLPETLHEVEKTVTFYIREPCPRCQGENTDIQYVECPVCNGKGRRMDFEVSWGFKSRREVFCNTCRGKGKIPKQICPECSGLGYVEKRWDFQVRIPPGSYERQYFFLRDIVCCEKEEVDKVSCDGKNLIVVVLLDDTSQFERKGYHLYSSCDVDYTTMVLGGKIKIPTIEGEVWHEVPEGMQVGGRIRLLNKGLIRPKKMGGRGDQYVTLNIRIPQKLSFRQKEALREYQKTLQE